MEGVSSQGSSGGVFEPMENSGYQVVEGVRKRGGRMRTIGGGVRTRGGLLGTRGGSSGQPVEITGRGHGRGRGRSRIRCRSRNQTRPVAKDELNLAHIDTYPKGHQLEKPLHTKRKRAWSPCAGPSTSGPLLNVAAAEGSGIQRPADDDIQQGEVETSFVIPPSPELFVECGQDETCPSTPQNMNPPRTVQHRGLQDDEIYTFLYNFGSESEDSDEEDTMAPVIPRTYQSLMETPDTDDHEININFTDTDMTDISDVYKPHNFFDFEWTAFPQAPFPPELRRETFSDINCGPTSPCVNPLDTFTAIWDRQFMEYIATETNRYAQELVQQIIVNESLYPQSRICDWHDTTPDELYVYFAIVLAMGVVTKTKIEEYWGSTPDIFYTPGFSAHMSLKRFQLLSKCLHFNNNGAMAALELDASAAKLYKIQPVIIHLNSKFQNMYNLNKNIALDESLLQWKGWLDINQFIPNKAAAVGIKTYEICESKTGYLWSFEVHSHKKTPSTQTVKSPLDAFTSAIVLKLVSGIENRGHTLWMDNFYNSPALARKLKSIGFDCVGTLRTNRQFVPDALSNLTKANMQPGQITGFTSGDIDLMVWRDSNRIAMISTYHGNAVNTFHGSTKPILMLDYNVMMGGVDKKDQMLSMYPIERKRTRIWYKNFFRRLLNVSVLNSYILVKHSTPFNHRSFRIALIKSILEKHSPSSVKPAVIDDRIYLARNHHLAEYPFLPGKSGRLRRHCTVCKKRVQTFCVGCNKAVCMTPCFLSIHK